MLSSSPPTTMMPHRRRKRGKRALAVWIYIFGFSLAALVATYMMFVEPPPPRKIVIASGGQNGAYYHFAQKYAEELRKEKMTVEVHGRRSQANVVSPFAPRKDILPGAHL